jgi:glutamate 5-kinase
MITKITAARMATEAGCAMAIALGTENSPLAALENGARTTWFAAQTDPQAARKRWIASMKPSGTLTIDDGAKSALMRGNSLLPAGVAQVSGRFGRGDVVAIADKTGAQLGQGLTRYTAAEARQILGRRSDEIAAVLGYEGRAALVHRDDMVL